MGDERKRIPIFRNPSFTIKTQDRKKHSIDRFSELYTDLDSANVTITSGRNHEVLKAHIFVLSNGEAHFREALKLS